MANKYHPLAPGTWDGQSSGFRTPDRPTHNGVDMAANLGTPIYAPATGKIAHVGINDDPNGYGSWLVIDCQDEWGLDFTFGHMHPSSMINPRTNRTWQYNESVMAGDIIAKVGNEGGSSGPHLHFEVSGPPGRFGGPWLNPNTAWLPGALDPRTAATTPAPPPPTPEVPPVTTPGTTKSVVKPGDLLVDYSSGVPNARSVKDAGFRGAVRYTSPAREAWMKGKPLSRSEADDYKREGLAIVSNYQFAKGGNTTSDWLRGYDGGKSDALVGIHLHNEAGGHPLAPIYVSVDAAPTQWMIDNQVLPYLRAWQEALGKERLGVYCNPTVLEACLKAGIGSWFWEHGWGGDKDGPAHPAAHIKQFEIDSGNVAGIGIDRNRVLKDRIGAWGEYEDVTYNPPVPANPPITPKQAYDIIDALAVGCGYDEGHAQRLRVYFHTTENQDWITDAWDVARYQARMQDGSYHFLIDDMKILNTVSIHDSAWGVLKDNARSVQVALVMTSGAIEKWQGQNPNQEGRPKSREQWLAHDKMLDMLGYVVSLLTKSENIPLDRVDIIGVGQNRKGFSSHNNYTYGSVQLLGYKDGTHWDVPDTFPYDYVFDRAREFLGQPVTPSLPPAPPDPDAYPLAWSNTYKEYWGPLEGPRESISNQNGDESQQSKDGLKRWQTLLGIPASGVYDDSTRRAAVRMQELKGWPVTGLVWKGEWDAVVRENWRFPIVTETPVPSLPPVPPNPRKINSGVKVKATQKLKDVTGPGHSDRWMVGGTDLGLMALNPEGDICAIFGDTFDGAVGTPGWRSPVGLLSKTKNLDDGIEWDHALGGDPNYARQLFPYNHAQPPYSGGDISTVIPSDIITVGDTMYIHGIVNQGFGNVLFTEIQQSKDNGHTWQHTGARFPADICHGNAQLWTWDLGPDGYVYVMSTGFQRNDPLILRRVKFDKITDPGAYEGWGWANGSWAWGNDPTPILEKVTSGERFGEMCLRYIQGQWVLVTFDASTVGGYDIDVRVFEKPTDNMYNAHKSTPIRGAGWGTESPDAVAQLYGPSIVPGSTFDGGFHILVSQWNTGTGWPYHAMQFKIPVDPVVPIPVTPGPVPVPETPPSVPVTPPIVTPPVVKPTPPKPPVVTPAPGTTYVSHSTGSFLKDIANVIKRLFGFGR